MLEKLVHGEKELLHTYVCIYRYICIADTCYCIATQSSVIHIIMFGL